MDDTRSNVGVAVSLRGQGEAGGALRNHDPEMTRRRVLSSFRWTKRVDGDQSQLDGHPSGVMQWLGGKGRRR